MQAVHVIIRVYRQKRQNNTGSSIRNPKCKKKKKNAKSYIIAVHRLFIMHGNRKYSRELKAVVAGGL